MICTGHGSVGRGIKSLFRLQEVFLVFIAWPKYCLSSVHVHVQALKYKHPVSLPFTFTFFLFLSPLYFLSSSFHLEEDSVAIGTRSSRRDTARTLSKNLSTFTSKGIWWGWGWGWGYKRERQGKGPRLCWTNACSSATTCWTACHSLVCLVLLRFHFDKSLLVRLNLSRLTPKFKLNVASRPQRA